MAAPFPTKITYGEKYGPAMELRTREEAAVYFERCVEHQMLAGGYGRDEAKRIERNNLLYYAGYYSEETRERVARLFPETGAANGE